MRNRPILGIGLLREIPAQSNAGGLWSGHIYDPQRGHSYRCTLRLEDHNRLRLRGYLGIPLLGKTTRWTRIPEEGGNRSPLR